MDRERKREERDKLDGAVIKHFIYWKNIQLIKCILLSFFWSSYTDVVAPTFFYLNQIHGCLNYKILLKLKTLVFFQVPLLSSPLISLVFSPSLCFLLCCLWLVVCTVEVRWRAFRPIQLVQARGLNNTQSPVTLHRLRLRSRCLVQLAVIQVQAHLSSPLSLPPVVSVLGSCLSLYFISHAHRHSAFFHSNPCPEEKCDVIFPTQSDTVFYLADDKTK